MLENLGNAVDSVDVSHAIIPPTNTTIGAVVFFRDVNGNAALDVGEDDRSFLRIAAGATALLDAAVIVPPAQSPGDVYIDVRAASTGDPGAAAQNSVFRVTSLSSQAATLHIGPTGNATASPRGEGSSDDVSSGTIGYADYTYTFDNDLLNEALGLEFVQLSLADTLAIPPGVSVAFVDTTGTRFPALSPGSNRFLVGALGAGETRGVRVVVSSATTPLHQLIGPSLSIRLRATSLIDTSRVNMTVDRLVAPAPINPDAALSIHQTFRQGSASAGDIVSLVVTVTNITDSVRVDSVKVSEFVQPQLDFAQSRDFAHGGGGLEWSPGSLDAGQSKTAVIKFVANSRVRAGWAKAVGRAAGVAESGGAVDAGPAVSAIRIENDIFATEGVILGDVFVDVDGDGVRGKGEKGVAGAAIYLESGEYAVTDSLGLFSLPRIFPGDRVVRLDEKSLDGVTLVDTVQMQRFGRRANERLVHLLPGGNARVSFPTTMPPPATVDVSQVVSCQEKVSVQRKARLYQSFTLPSSYFALGRAELLRGFEDGLRPIIDFLDDHPDWRVFLEGHTDNLPIHTREFPSNYELSLARAQSVSIFLRQYGVEKSRILFRGYGDQRPVASNETIEGRRLNRRVDVNFIPPDVRVEDGEIENLGALVRDMSTLPDSFYVSVFWEFATTSGERRGADLVLHLPPVLQSQSVVVRFDGREVPAVDDVYSVDGFVRSHPISCVMSFVATDADTSLVRRLTAALTLAATERLEGETLLLQPMRHGYESKPGRMFDLTRWTQKVEVTEFAPAASNNAPSMEAIKRRGQSSRSSVFLQEPIDGSVFSNRDRITVRARMPVGCRFAVAVDGVPVEDSNIGQRTIDLSNGFEAITWYGVQIRRGWNTVTLAATLLDGSTMADTIRIALASQPSALEPVRKRWLIPADGYTSGVVRFSIRDALDLGVIDGTVGTIVEGGDLVAVPDARPLEQGMQVVSEGGFFALRLKPRGNTGHARIVVASGKLDAEAIVVYVPPQRPLMATGIVDLRLGAYRKSGRGSSLGVENYVDGPKFEAESRAFVQGTIGKGFGLTARVDTKKHTDDPLLKDLSPDRQYPILGDGSSLNYAAPSQGGNYVSVDRGESHLRYGDFRTPLDHGEFLNYTRAATGFTSTLVRGTGALEAFVTRTNFSTFKDEIPADGTSGFYYLTRRPIVENSERLIVETRDRYRSEKILRLAPMVRNRDYTINPFDGSILFKEPVAAYDYDFNPVTIVITYEVETRDRNTYLYGARGVLTENRNHRLGASVVANSGDGSSWALYGADGEVSRGGFSVGGEVARSDAEDTPGGNAYKVTGAFRNKRSDVSVYHRRVDGSFSNPSFRGSRLELSSLKSGFEGRVALASALTVRADGYVHQLHRTNERRETVRGLFGVQRGRFRLSGGGRVAGHEGPDRDEEGLLALLGLSYGDEARAGIATNWETNIASETVEDYPDRLKTTGTIPVGHRARIVATHEYLTSSGRPSSNQFALGAEGRVTPSTKAFTRYSMDRTAGEARMGAVSGLTQNIRVAKDISATLGVEGFSSLADRDEDEYVAFRSGLTVRVPNSHFMETQYENRFQSSHVRHMLRINGARQGSAGTAVMASNALALTNHEDSDDEISYHGTIAGAYRPPYSAVQGLVMMRNHYERFTPVDPDAITWRLVVSGDVNFLPTAVHELRLKYAFKHVEDYSFATSVTTNSDLVLGQFVYHFARFWDVDMWGRWTGRRHGFSQTSTGIEVGRMVAGSIRLGVGYSLGGFEDRDISGEEAWSSGFGVRIQVILSDWLLNEFQRIR